MKFIDNSRFMSTSLSNFTDNVSKKKSHEAIMLNINVIFKTSKLKKICL